MAISKPDAVLGCLSDTGTVLGIEVDKDIKPHTALHLVRGMHMASTAFRLEAVLL